MRAEWRRYLAGLVLGLAVLTGCSEDPAPADDVPALAERLDRAEQAIADGDYGRARTSLDALAAATAQARVANRITDEQANRILDAVAEVLRALREVEAES